MIMMKFLRQVERYKQLLSIREYTFFKKYGYDSDIVPMFLTKNSYILEIHI